jgi:hypothetical protein
MRSKIRTDLAENKLILLFLAARMPAGIDHDEIVRFNMDGGWMLYFDMEQYLLELTEDGLLQLSDDAGGKLYAATAEGLNVLGLLKAKIPLSIRSFIDGMLAERRAEMERDQEITADYVQDSAFEYPVTLRIRENRAKLMELNLTAPSAEAAELVCRRFRAEAADIYASLIERLTRDEAMPEENP